MLMRREGIEYSRWAPLESTEDDDGRDVVDEPDDNGEGGGLRLGSSCGIL